MPGDRIGFDSECPKQVQKTQAHGCNGRLRRRHSRDARGLLSPLLIGEGRWREDRAIEPVGSELLHIRGGVPYGPRTVECHRRMGPHTHVLASLPREHEGDLPDRRRAKAKVDIRIGKRALLTRSKRLSSLR